MTYHNFSIHNLDSRKLMEEQLISSLKRGLPSTVKLIAYNFSRVGDSLYALLCQKQKTGTLEWLTLRLAGHPMWLKEAQQLFIDFGSPADLNRLAIQVEDLFKKPKVNDYFYKLSSLEIAVLRFLDACQKQNMIWAVRLPENIFAARKEIPFDLKSDFIEANLFLGDRNNFNTMLLPVEAKKYQSELAVLFGRNLLFSQFTRGRFLRLLPTNQWIQPIIESEKVKENDWKEQIANEYGQQLIDVYEKGKNI